MSHTPGPWVVGVQGVFTTNPNYCLCRMWDGTRIEETEANKRLIAAAPDLLAACEELLLVAGTYKPIDMYDWERVSAVIDRAKAALKKARGG